MSKQSWIRAGGRLLFCLALCVSAAAAAPAQAEDPCTPDWQPFGGAGMNNFVRAMALYDDGSGSGSQLFVGGQFTTSDGVTTNGIAKWTGSAWEAIGSGVGGNSFLLGVHALAVFDDGQGAGPQLYAGGQFTSMDGIAADGIARWNGTQWSLVGTGAMSPALSIVRALVVHDDGTGNGPALYATGSFTSISGVSALRVAKWNGVSWSNVGGGLGSSGYALASKDSGVPGVARLYAGGHFSTMDGGAASCIARWDGTAWHPLGPGTTNGIHALLGVPADGAQPASLYVGGSFLQAGVEAASCIALWQGCAKPKCALADLNCDGTVDGADLGMLLAAWGPCSGCAADLNQDGQVDGGDLGMLLANWSA